MVFFMLFVVAFLILFLSNYSFLSLKILKMLDSFSFMFNFNILSGSFFYVLMVVSFFVLVFSFYYQSISFDFIRFILTTLMFVLSMMILIFHSNCFSLILGWDGLGITSYFLVNYYNNWSSINGGMVTMLTNRFGDFLIFWVLSFLIFSNQMETLEKGSFIVFVFIIGAFTKSAQMPFSSWLPLAMAAPTPISSLVHSSTLVTAGIFIILKYFSFLMYSKSLTFLFIFGLMTLTVASLTGIFEVDGKKIIALSTLSQLGFMVLCLGLNLPLASFFHLLSHAFFKSCMFIQMGMFIHSNTNNQDMRGFGENFFLSKISCSIMMICCLSLMGFIFMSGFITKEFIILWASSSNFGVLIFFIFLMVIMLTLMYSMRLISSLLINSQITMGKNKSMISNIFSSIALFGFSCLFGWFFYFNIFYFPVEIVFSEKLIVLTLFFLVLSLFYFSIVFSEQISLNSIFFQDHMYKLTTKMNMKGFSLSENEVLNFKFNFVFKKFNFYSLFDMLKSFYIVFPIIIIFITLLF